IDGRLAEVRRIEPVARVGVLIETGDGLPAIRRTTGGKEPDCVPNHPPTKTKRAVVVPHDPAHILKALILQLLRQVISLPACIGYSRIERTAPGVAAFFWNDIGNDTAHLLLRRRGARPDAHLLDVRLIEPQR